MNFKSLALAAAMTGAAAFSAGAATVVFDAAQTYGTVFNFQSSAKTWGVNYGWVNTPSTAYTVFTSSSSFELSLLDYGKGYPTPSNQMTSGYYLRAFDGAGYNDVLDRLTDNCAAAYGLGAGKCDHMLSENYDGPIAGVRVPSELEGRAVIGRYAAGTYLFGVYDSKDPRAATASFQIAAVPLPATGLALIAGLGGLAALGARRRRKAA